MSLRPVGMVITAASDHRRQLARAVRNGKRLIGARPTHWRQGFNLLLGQLDLVVDMRGVAKGSEIENSRDGDPRRHLRMIQYERREMAAGRPARHYDGARDAMLCTLRVEPVERGSHLIGDLSQTRLRGERISGQCSRPTAGQRTFCEEGKYFLAVALPITAMNVNKARCLRVVGGIEVPFRPLSRSIRQIEVF